MPFRPDFFLRTVLALCGFFFVAWLVQTIRLRRALRRAAALEAGDKTVEYRIERFDILWYPVLTASPASKTVVSVKAGLPHCRKCLQALKLAEEEWACAKCGTKYPEAVADIASLDAVAKTATGYFLERHPGYHAAAPAAKA